VPGVSDKRGLGKGRFGLGIMEVSDDMLRDVEVGVSAASTAYVEPVVKARVPVFAKTDTAMTARAKDRRIFYDLNKQIEFVLLIRFLLVGVLYFEVGRRQRESEKRE
jgi:hypothetical protein